MRVHGTQNLDIRSFPCLWVVDRTLGHQLRSGKLGDHVRSLGHTIHWLGDHLADHFGREIPLLEDRLDLCLVSLDCDHEHPLL